MKKAVYLAGVAAFQVIGMPAFAQDAPQANSDTNGGDIIVTARRSEERLQDVPISITVMSQDALTKRNISSSADLGSYVPSLSTNANFGPEKSSFAIRGFIQEGRTAPSVGVYFADVVAPRANTGTTSGNGAGVGSMFDLQNVQVLKGPQGTLFGRNTTGGAILLVPTKPTDKFEGYVEGTLGDYNERRLQAVVNVPLSDTFRIRAAADWNKRDGYLRNLSDVGPKDFGNVNYFAGRLSLVGDLTPDLENYTIFSYSRSNTHGTIAKMLACDTDPKYYDPAGPYNFGALGQFTGPLGCAQVARGQAAGDYWTVDNSDPHPRELQETWQAINTTTWKASDTLTVKNIISYAQFREDTSFSLFGDNLTYPGGTFPGLTLETGSTGSYADQSTFTEEFQLQGRTTDGRLTWQAGAYLEVSKPLKFNSAFNDIFVSCSDARAFQCVNSSGFGNIFIANIADSFNNKGLYAQGTYKLTDQLSLTGGIRYTMDRMKDDSRNINANIDTPGAPIFTCQNVLLFGVGHPASGPLGAECDNVLHYKSNAPTWLIDLDYKPTNDLLLYGKWARGYRQGSIISVNLGFETWKPEKVDTYEVGAKWSFRGSMPGYFNIAGFYNNFRDQQLAADAVVKPAYVGLLAPAQVIVNAGKSRIWGIEIDSSIKPFTGFQLDASYAYLNTKLLSVNAPTSPFYDLTVAANVGDPLAQSPKNRVTVTATYTLPLEESVGRVSFGGTFTHTDANQVHQEILAPNTYKVPAIDQLNLNVDWNSVFGHPVDLSFFMTNVTNQKVFVYPIATAPTNGTEVGFLDLPRMFGFRLKYHFGQ